MASFVFILDRTIKKQTSDGLIPQYVLADLYAWLETHSGFTNHAPVVAHIPTNSSSKP